MTGNNKLCYYLIGVCGGSASGKSLFINELKAGFAKDKICVISQDDYYKCTEFQQRDNLGIINFDLPEAIDEDNVIADLFRLSKGETIEKLEYTFEHKDKIPATNFFKPSPIIIIEGLFIFFYSKLSQLIDCKIYIDCEEDIRFKRRLKRDITERGISEKMVLHQWQNHVYPAFEKYVLPNRQKADIVINNDFNYSKGLDVVISHIQDVLRR